MDFMLLAATPYPWNYLLGWTLSILALFLILLILVQRGRGGGLTGALGGMGGQSAFGTKAGDLFTRVTIGVAAVWILLCMLSIKVLNPSAGKPVFDRTETTLPLDPKLREKEPKDKKRFDLPVEGDDAATAPTGDSGKEKAPATSTTDDAPPPDSKPGDSKSADDSAPPAKDAPTTPNKSSDAPTPDTSKQPTEPK